MATPTEASSEDGGFRTVHINDRAANEPAKFCSNVVSTSKYSAASFLPMFLFESFRKLANFYFLIIAILQTIPFTSNTKGVPFTAVPLTFVIGVSCVLAALEDWKRHKADNEANSTKASVWQQVAGAYESAPWGSVRVGVLVRLRYYEVCPADIVLLASSDPNGICFIETKSLDGETNLKIRVALPPTVERIGTRAEDAAKLRGHVVCEQPNNVIHSFTGTLHVAMFAGDARAAGKEPVNEKSLFLRGCVLRNTQWAVGVVVNSGMETKIMMSNSAQAPHKISGLDREVNKNVILMLCMIISFCLVGATGAIVWTGKYGGHMWFLRLKDVNAAAFFQVFLTNTLHPTPSSAFWKCSA